MSNGFDYIDDEAYQNWCDEQEAAHFAKMHDDVEYATRLADSMPRDTECERAARWLSGSLGGH
jgi:hypothetical protein